MKKFLTAAALAGCIAITSTPAQATTMIQLSTTQLVDASDSIVRGVITEVWTEEDDNGIVWTRSQIEVSKTLKGDSKRSAYIVDQMGGKFGGNLTHMAGTARFSVGEEGVFFLETLASGRVTTVGLSQGKYTARMDPYSRELIAQRYAPAPRQAYDHRFIPMPKAGEKLFLSDLIASIEDRVEQGWDGKAIPGKSLERLQQINLEVVR
jgi:hypothetical protein